MGVGVAVVGQGSASFGYRCATTASNFCSGSRSGHTPAPSHTHAVRFVAVAVLVALAVGAPVQARTPEIDALRARAEAGDAEAQLDLGGMYGNGNGVSQDDAEAVRWYRLAADCSGRRRGSDGVEGA